MEDKQQAEVSRRRRVSGGSDARAQTLERLKTIRKGQRRPSYDIKIDEPIYDTIDEDEYNNLVTKRREEFSGFIVGDAGDGYMEDGEEEDWTQPSVPDEDSESYGEHTRKALETEKPRLLSMFESSACNKKRAHHHSDSSIVDDIIAEFCPDETHRERRRLGLGLGFNTYKVDNPVVDVFDSPPTGERVKLKMPEEEVKPGGDSTSHQLKADPVLKNECAQVFCR